MGSHRFPHWAGRCWFSMYCMTTVRGVPGEVGAGPEVAAPQIAAYGRVVLLGLETVDRFGELHLRRVVHEEVDVVLFAVELIQFGLEVRADLAHDLLRVGQHGLGERVPPVFGVKTQVEMQVLDDVSAGAYIGVRIPSW
jgi:hypothetical protein